MPSRGRWWLTWEAEAGAARRVETPGAGRRSRGLRRGLSGGAGGRDADPSGRTVAWARRLSRSPNQSSATLLFRQIRCPVIRSEVINLS